MKKLLCFVFAILLTACNTSESIESLRNIIVENHNGLVETSHFKKTLFLEKYEDPIEIYDGESLIDGDYVSVKDDSNLLLNFDSDKHVYVEENSEFYVKASGDENSTVTSLDLVNGSVFVAIDKKLNDNESFDISVGDVSLSVRGTIFSVSNMFSFDNSNKAIVINTYEGAVSVDIANSDKSLLIKEGESSVLMVKEDETVFISKNQIDESFWKEQNNTIKLINNNDDKDYILPISYVQLSDNLINILQKYYNKEQLPELKRTIKIAKTDFNELFGRIITIDDEDYRVIEVDGCEAKLLGMKTISSNLGYNGPSIIKYGYHIKYSDLGVDSYLNNTFYNSLSDELKAAIIPKYVYQSVLIHDWLDDHLSGEYLLSIRDSDFIQNIYINKQYDIGERYVYLISMADVCDYFGNEISNNQLDSLFYDGEVKNEYFWFRDLGCGRDVRNLNDMRVFETLVQVYSSRQKSCDIVNPTATEAYPGGYQAIRPCFVVDLSLVDFIIK